MKKNIYRTLKLAYLATYFLLFLSFYVPNYVFEVGAFEYDYVNHYLDEAATFVMAVAASVAVYMRVLRSGARLLKEAVGYALPVLLYAVPYYYLYALAYGYDSIEGLLAGLLIGAIQTLITLLVILAGFALLRFNARRCAERVAIVNVPELRRKNMTPEIRRGFEREVRSLMLASSEDERIFSGRSVIVNSIFVAALARFGIGLAEELYNTVTYLVDYAGTYRTDELLTMLLGYAALVVELIVATVAAAAVRKLILVCEVGTEEEISDEE